MRYIIRPLAVLLLLLIAVWGYTAWKKPEGQSATMALLRQAGSMLGIATPPPPLPGSVDAPRGALLGGGFHLTNQAGQPVTEASYGQDWQLVYFGYTYCPDVCPTELATIASALDQLPPAALARVMPLFITIDPERDTPAVMADYVARFHPKLQGLTGTPEQIAAVAQEFRVYYAKARSAAATYYLMDHSSFAYLVAPDHHVQVIFRPDATPEQIAAGIEQRLGIPAHH